MERLRRLHRIKTKHRTVRLGFLLVAGLFAITPYAEHSWGSYHWARTTSPFTLLTVDSMTPEWDYELSLPLGDANGG